MKRAIPTREEFVAASSRKARRLATRTSAHRTHAVAKVALSCILAAGLMLPVQSLAVAEEGAAPAAESVPEAAPLVEAPAADEGISAHATAGPFEITGGTAGTDYSFSGTVLTILSPKPMTISTPAPTDNTIQIAAGVQADLMLANVTIQQANAPAIDLVTNINDTASGAPATDGAQIQNPTSLYLRIKDGSVNTLTTKGGTNDAGIRCGEGSILTIDDELDNRLQGGGQAPVEGEKLASDVVLVGGKTIAAGSKSTELDSENPGYLNVIGGGYAPGVGGSTYENGGTMTFNGGNLDIRTYGWDLAGEGGASFAAGIGAAGSADGTATVMTFNGGNINAYGGLHGAGIGAGHSGWDSSFPGQKAGTIRTRGSGRFGNVAGNITINGGYIYSHGGWHGGAFGSACWSSNRGKTIKVTGGTLIPIAGTGGGGAHTGDYAVFPEIGGSGGYVEITGGSVRCTDPSIRFQGIGKTAWGNNAYLEPGYNVNDANDPNKVFMVKIDLSSEIKKKDESGNYITDGNNLVAKWELLVAGQRYDYGAPLQFDDGKLYLWLPKSATSKQIMVNMTYYDEDGNEVAIKPLFRNPNSEDVLKRYVEFELPHDYTDNLVKNYDGLPFTKYSVEEAGNEIITKENPPKKLNLDSKMTCTYQRYTAVDGESIGEEINNNAMPSDEGVMRFIMTSTQYSEEKEDGFDQNYWGHRAYGWCEIKPVPSQVKLVEAEWVADKEPGENEHDARQQILVRADIGGGYFDNDKTKPVADTCKAPTGKVQLYIDDEPIGDPVELRFEPVELEDGTVLPANAQAVPNGKGGSYTHFEYIFTPADEDFHVPNEASDENNKHKVSLRYERGLNYFASANPDEDESVPNAEIRIKPVDPEAAVEADPDNGPKELESNPPKDDGEDGKLIEGSMEIQYVRPTEDDPHPGMVTIKVKTPSSAPIEITTDEGDIIEAKVVVDENGKPIRGEDGTYEIQIDPKLIGTTTLHIEQKPNGAYTATTWEYEVKVLPDPGIDPIRVTSKSAKNLTHPNSPTQPGDRIRFELTAENTALGSVWKNVVATDVIPAGLTLDTATVRLENKADAYNDALTEATDATPATLGRGQFSVSAAADGRVQLNAFAGDIGGGTKAVVSFECVVDAGAVILPSSAAQSWIRTTFRQRAKSRTLLTTRRPRRPTRHTLAMTPRSRTPTPKRGIWLLPKASRT